MLGVCEACELDGVIAIQQVDVVEVGVTGPAYGEHVAEGIPEGLPIHRLLCGDHAAGSST